MSYGVVIFTFPLQPEGVCYLFPLDEAVFAGFVGLVVLVTFSGEEDHVAGVRAVLIAYLMASRRLSITRQEVLSSIPRRMSQMIARGSLSGCCRRLL